MSRKKPRESLKIQKEIYWTLLTMACVMALVIATVSIIVNVNSERKNLDQNLANMAQAIAKNQMVSAEMEGHSSKEQMDSYLSSLKETILNVDVISIVDKYNTRIYHSNKAFIGTRYDGTQPDFEKAGNALYVTSDVGPSGSQRRAYAAIYDKDGNYIGFVLAVMLKQNFNRIIANAIIVHVICAVGMIFFAFLLSDRLSRRIKHRLHGYEPDTFSQMFSMRENILDALEEGILAIEPDESIVYMNGAAAKMLHVKREEMKNHSIHELAMEFPLESILRQGEKLFGESIDTNILADLVPVMEQGSIVGALCILRDRTEYTKLMEDLSGVRYMVDSMRANNHDFINKLHVILGLIQMGETDKAKDYIANITSIQQKVLHTIMQNIKDPSVAALLIGKYARAAELDIHFSLEPGSTLSRKDIRLPSGDLVTIIGNLLDNAMEAMNQKDCMPKELSVSIFTKPHAMLIQVDDTGIGMKEDKKEQIFENGFSTKGENRGTGMYVISELVKKHNGSIHVESEEDVGTSITVTLTEERRNANV